MEIQFKYASIKTDQFAVLDVPSVTSINEYSLSGEVQTGNNYSARSIMITVSANYKVHDKLVMTIKVSSFFEIEEDSWNSLKDGEYVVIPKDFLLHIGGIAFSTTRGVLFAKTEGTDLNRIILPIIYMDQVIKGDMKIAIPEGE